jgi:hypothetical protein
MSQFPWHRAYPVTFDDFPLTEDEKKRNEEEQQRKAEETQPRYVVGLFDLDHSQK